MKDFFYVSKIEEVPNAGGVYWNLPVPALVEMALRRGEGILTEKGALRVTTGKYTGRSPNDRFIVDEDQVHDFIDWGEVNKPISPDRYEQLRGRLLAYLQGKQLFVFDGFVGTEPKYRLPVRVINEMAWQNLTARQLLIRPRDEERLFFKPEFTVLAAPGFKAMPDADGTNSEAFIVINFSRREVLIGGTAYAGEIKKSLFSVMNFLLTDRGVLPMHCSANVGVNDDVCLFFGLSGTGKTTLSADPHRQLIGDDEHGWSEGGVFNFEGGCYAKCIGLDKEKEPVIWNAIRFGSVLENVIVSADGNINFESNELTENTRVAYPIEYVENSRPGSRGAHPTTILFLTADAFGVLPPVARLTETEAMYYFLSGYTSKLAGTERGVTEPQAVFSACFGAPFLPRSPHIYARALGERIRKHQVRVFLINTGWIAGPYGIGHRISLEYTRSIVSAAIDGKLDEVPYQEHPVFQFKVPQYCPGVPSQILWPSVSWSDVDEYWRQATSLSERFAANFARFTGVPQSIQLAGPRKPSEINR